MCICFYTLLTGNTVFLTYSLPRKPFSAPKPCRSFLVHGWDANESCMQSRSSETGKKLTLHNFLLLYLRSRFKNSYFVLHQGFQTPLRLWRRAFIFFSVFGIPDEKFALVFCLLLSYSRKHAIALLN